MTKEQPSGASKTSANVMLGTSDWLEHTFGAPSVRNPGGRSRRTHRFTIKFEGLGLEVTVEGRPEMTAAMTLEYLHTVGLVRRAKPQPFFVELPEDGGGVMVPDFLFEFLETGRWVPYVVETVTERFLSREEERKHDCCATFLAAHGISYLLWTDKRPWSSAFKRNLLSMRRSAGEPVMASDAERLLDLFLKRPTLTLEQIYIEGCDLTLVEALAWHGKVFYPLMESIDGGTIVSRQPDLSFASRLMQSKPDAEAWWSGLPNAEDGSTGAG